MDVTEQLEQAKAQFKPVTVERLIPVDLDLGHLAVFDKNPLDTKQKSAKDLEDYLHSLARDSAQLLYNAVFSLETTATEDGVFVDLPAPVTVLPREKPLPKDKPMTKWEKFAKEKNIQNRKKSRMVFDEATGEYRPRWGYGSAANDSLNDWLIPVPSNADPYDDMYAKKREEKKERVDKNRKQQLRNQGEAAAIERGVDPRAARKAELEAKLRASKKATASAGVFDRKLDGDVKPKGVKRQFAPTVGDTSAERESEKAMAARVLKKQAATMGDVNTKKATHLMQQLEERKNRAMNSRDGKKGAKRGASSSGRGDKGAKKRKMK
ncbi:Rhodanese- sulfurtransferase [Allomyces javanicus]|nr:Rhodanese- sulfurtransferase [Allomyces javanicus]